MDDAVRELINCIIDYVIKIPGATFEISRYPADICRRYPEYSAPFCRFSILPEPINGRFEPKYISRGHIEHWSGNMDCNEDDLVYLLEQLKKLEQPEDDNHE